MGGFSKNVTSKKREGSLTDGDKARALCLKNTREFISRCLHYLAQTGCDTAYVEEPNEIPYESRDGFWAWTNGGHEAMVPVSLSEVIDEDAYPEALKPYVEDQRKEIKKAWDKDYPDKPYEKIRWEDPSCDERDLFCEFEHDWWVDCGSYYWKFLAMILAPNDPPNESGEWEVYLDAYLNDDYGYGRDEIPWLRFYGMATNRTRGDWERTISIMEFAKLFEKKIDKLAKEAVESLPK